MTVRTLSKRIGVLSLGLLPVLPAVTVAAVAASAVASAGELPAGVESAINNGDYNEAQNALIAALKGKEITPASADVLHMAMLLDVIRTTDPAIMTEFAAESKMKCKFLAEFAADAEWLELYLGCGLVPYHTPMGIDVLYRIWRADKGAVKNKGLAVALASVWGGGETDPNPPIAKKNPNRYNPVWRYKFFQKHADDKRMHPGYKKLRPWELRFTVGIPQQDWDDESFEWALENINVPWDRYDYACWAAVYTDPSMFGDTVQGGMYNYPYADISWAEATHRNGGVCGAMSHLGCVAAMAHGIPAYTVGQPGHCAYGFRIKRGDWRGGFGGPDGGMHNRIFGNQAPTSYLLMETVFKDDATIEKAYRHSHCAKALEAIGDKEAAIAMWEKTLKISPLHPFFRASYHKLLKEKGMTPDQAFEYLSDLIPLYKKNGFASINVTEDLQELIAGMTDDQRATLYGKMHKMIAGTPSSWAIKSAPIIEKQSASLKSEAAKEKYLASVFATHMGAEDATTFGQILEWAVKSYIESGQEEIFGRAFSKAAASAGTGGGKADAERTKKMTAAYNKAIIAAEQARSAPAFKSLTEAAVKATGKCTVNIPLKAAKELPGKPAAAALFRISTTSSYDSPAWHINITTPTGGKCHTAKEEKPHFIVELPERKSLTGCIIRKTDGNEHRMKKATVYTSEDGATWKPRESTDNMPKEWVVKFADGTPGKWVKVEFDNSAAPDFAHISHFVIYTK